MDALHRGRLVAHFQPVVALPEREVVGFEALARLDDPRTGTLRAASFVPLAEEHGVIAALGERMLRLAIRAAARWRRSSALATASVSTNVSPAQLVDPGFPDLVGRLVRAEGLVPSALVLEITENAAVADDVRPALARLARMGVRLALDDFGMGFANLDHLRRLPVHVLKLDRSFVVGAGGPGPDRTIVRAAVDLAGSLGMTIIAEGVEHEDQADALYSLGCRHAQGLLFADAGPDPLERARSVRRVRRPDPAPVAVAPWDADVEARVLAVAQLLSTPDDVRRGAAYEVAARLAAAAGEAPEVCYLAPRLALVHEDAAGGDVGSPAGIVAGEAGIRALHDDPAAGEHERRAAAVVGPRPESSPRRAAPAVPGRPGRSRRPALASPGPAGPTPPRSPSSRVSRSRSCRRRTSSSISRPGGCAGAGTTSVSGRSWASPRPWSTPTTGARCCVSSSRSRDASSARRAPPSTEIARAGRPVTVALLDVDELKRLNDRSGHARGDEVLRGVAACVAQAVPPDRRWTLGRVGGDEFAVVLDGHDPDTVRERLERARTRCRRELGTAFSFGVSAAVAGWEARDILSAADDALYRAKRARRP